MMAESKFIGIKGLRLHYLDHGPKDRPVLFCIHGRTRCAHDFDALARSLNGRYRLIAPDIRGRGDSQWGPVEQYNTTVYTDDISRMIDTIGVERLSLLGTSMGGRVAIAYAASYPQRVERLVLNDSGPDLEPEAAERIDRMVREAPPTFADIDQAVAYYRGYGLGASDENQLRESFRWLLKPTSDGQLTWKMDPMLRRLPSPLSTIRSYWPEFERLQIPVFVLRGALSNILSPSMAARIAKVGRDVRIVEIPNSGHAPSLVEPESLAALRMFLG
jgi:esterase